MTDMLTMIRTLGDQLRWASQIELPEIEAADEILVAGMGGSGIAGDYGAALASSSTGRVTVHKGYAPRPGWAERARPTVIAISYSGNTEETLDLAEAAHEAGLPVVTATTGGRLAALSEDRRWPSIAVPAGLQPRAAVGYLVGAMARLLAGAGILGDQRPAIEEAAAAVDEVTTEGSPRWMAASELAKELVGRITVVYGAGPISGTVAQRWKTQINENAKMPAWWSLLPELDHNELVGWETLGDLTRESVAVVALTDRSDHPRVADRLAHSRELTMSAVPWLAEVVSDGESELARLLTLTAHGDLVSWMLAEAAGVDPVPVDTIEKLKKLLVKD